MKLKKIEIMNFKGIGALTIPIEDDLEVRGANGVGKTTIADAFNWCLFGKSSLWASDFGVQPVDEHGEKVPELVTSVQISLNIGKNVVTLERGLKDKYVKPRGQAIPVYQGTITVFHVDGVPAKKNEFDKYVSELIDSEDGFKLLSNSRYFNEVLDWRKRRQVLLSLSGNTDAFEELIKKQKIAKENVASLKKELNGFEPRIAEVKNDMPTAVEGPIENSLELQEELAQAQKSRQELNNDAEKYRLTVKKEQIVANLNSISIKHAARCETARIDIAMIDREIARIEEAQTFMRKEWQEIKHSVVSLDDACPTCGTIYCEENIHQQVEKHEQWKKESIEKLNQQGLANKMKISDLQEKRKELDSKMPKTSIMSTPEYQQLDEELQGVNSKLEALEQGNDGTLEKLDAQIKDLEIRRARSVELTAIMAKRTEKELRIKELQEQQKEKGDAYEQAEKALVEAEAAITALVTSNEKEINSKFELVSFKLFDTLVSGEMVDTCEVSYKGVPYTDLSNSEKIRAGLDVIRTFSKEWGMELPVFVDNREAITELPDMGDIQVISLIVSPSDHFLSFNQVAKQKQGVML